MITLFTSYYPEPNPVRQKELAECLEKNVQNTEIDKICLLLEGDVVPPVESTKIQTRHTQDRPGYSDYLDWVKEEALDGNNLSIVANSDIYFDSSIGALFAALKPDQAVALSRWELSSNGKPALFDRNDSQDAWIFKGSPRAIVSDYLMGVPRCDNRMLYELQAAGYEVINPAFSIRSFHLHEGEPQEYGNENLPHYVDPPYSYLWPHNLFSLPKTLYYNARFPGQSIGWRLDKRKLAQFFPIRMLRKVIRLSKRTFS